MLSMFGRGEEPKPPMTPGTAPVAATRPANTNGPTLRATPPTARARGFESPPSVGQYLVHLASDIRSFTRAEISGTVVGATPAEVQRLARLTAKLKGRYFAQAARSHQQRARTGLRGGHPLPRALALHV